MESDDFSKFRAAHPSLEQAIDRCERPDWLIRLAYEAMPDHKVAIRFGINAAALLHGDREEWLLGSPRNFLFPRRLEAVDLWASATDGDYLRDVNNLRAFALAALPATLLTVLVHEVSQPRRWVDGLLYGACFVVMLVLTLPIQRVLAWVVARQVAQIDDESALQMVLDEIVKGMAKNPAKIPSVVSNVESKVYSHLRHHSAR